jgi:hypothetical protein
MDDPSYREADGSKGSYLLNTINRRVMNIDGIQEGSGKEGVVEELEIKGICIVKAVPIDEVDRVGADVQ